MATAQPGGLLGLRGTPVVGRLTVAGVWGRDMRPPVWAAEAEQLAGLPALPLLVDHLAVIRPSGLVDVGRAVAYRWVDEPPHVVVLADVWDESVAAAVARGQLCGFSLGKAASEVSLTSRPAYSACRVLSWGPAALAVWDAYGAAAGVPR